VAFWRSSRRTGLALAALFFTLIPLLIWYLNFKYGFSMHPEQPDLAREVRERDYFFVASFMVFGLLVAGGIGALMRSIAEAACRRAWPRLAHGEPGAAARGGATVRQHGQRLARPRDFGARFRHRPCSNRSSRMASSSSPATTTPSPCGMHRKSSTSGPT
jgi:hypothetical protein